MHIVDAHHHLWDLNAVHYPWLMDRGTVRFFGDPTPIQHDYLVADFRRDAAALELLGSVHIQVGAAASDELAETAWQQSNHDATGLPSAIVAACDLTRADLDVALDAHAAHANVRGIRQIIGRADSEDNKTGSGKLLASAAWREGLRLLRDRALSFDLQLTPSQMLDAARVFADLDGLNVALCHAGSPMHFSPSGIAEWRSGIAALADVPQLVCKMSGFGMFNPTWRTADIAPYVEFCIETFGAERCMFGSNFPVDKLYRDYTALWQAYAEIVAPLPPADQRQVFVETAQRFYRLELDQ